jgi:hypothetical protein
MLAPSRKPLFVVMLACGIFLLFALAVRGCSLALGPYFMDVVGGFKDKISAFEDAFAEEPAADLDHVKLCAINGERAWLLRWHPTTPMEDEEMDRLADRVWSRIHSDADPVQDPVIMAAEGHLLTYGHPLPSELVQDCMDD